MAVIDLIGTDANGSGAISSGSGKTKQKYQALALVDKGQLPAVGASYTMIDSSTVTVGATTIALVVKDLTYKNKSRFIPSGKMNGIKDGTVNMTSGIIYGDDVVEKPTGEITELFTITFENYFQNVEGFNALRINADQFDVVLFTENTAEIYTRASNNTLLSEIMDAADGSHNSRNGSFKISARGIDGQVVPLKGVLKSQLADDVKFVFTQGTLVNLTKGTCNGVFTRYTLTDDETNGTMPLTVAPVVDCGTFSLFKIVSGVYVPSTGSTFCSITTNGTVTVPTGHAAGSTKYVAIYQNEVGVYGEYPFEINN